MKTRVIYLAVVMALLLSLLAPVFGLSERALAAGTWYVKAGGDDLLGNGTASNPFATITKAITTAVAGDTISVAAGTYNENVVISKALTIQGAGLASTFINGKNTGANVAAVDITVSGNVKLDGFTITNAPVTADGDFRAGVRTNSGGGGIYTISHNKIIGTKNVSGTADYGINGVASGTENLVITYNVVTGTASNNIYRLNPRGTTEIGNNTLDAGSGAHGATAIFEPTSGVNVTALQSVHDNIINMGTAGPNDTGNRVVGIDFSSQGVGVGGFANGSIAIANNKISNVKSNGQGIALRNQISIAADGNIIGATVSGNTITGAAGNPLDTEGIITVGLVTNASITNNVVTGLEYGFREAVYPPAVAVAAGTKLNGNFFSNNVNGVLTNRTAGSTLDARGNWWGDATGPGTVGLGTGDRVSANVVYDPWLRIPAWYEQPTASNTWTSVYGSQQIRQTFTPGAAHYVNGASFILYKQGLPDYKVTIDLIGPGTVTLDSTTFEARDLTTVPTWKEFRFTTGSPLAAGTVYALKISGNGGDSSNCVNLSINSTNTYSNGYLETSSNGGSSWSGVGSQDLAFKEGQLPMSPSILSVTSVSPILGTRLQTLDVTITGTNLTGAQLGFSASGITQNARSVNTPTQITQSITITSDATVGASDVTVTSPGGKVTRAAGFTVKPVAPTITLVNPNKGLPGQNLDVVITGTNLTGATVNFGTTGITTSSFKVVSATEITAKIAISAAAAPGPRTVSITTAGGTATAGFNVDAPPGWYEQQTASNSNADVYGLLQIYQTFIPLTSHNLDTVSFDLSKTGIPPGSMTIALWRVDAGHKPVGAALCSTSFFGASLTAGWVEKMLPSYPVVAGTEYALVLSLSGDLNNKVVARLNTIASYTRGGAGSSTDGGLTWLFSTVSDLAFKEGQAPNSPTITSVSPNVGTQNTTVTSVTITGTNFGTSATVTLSGLGVTASGGATSDTLITRDIAIAADAIAGARDVSVATSNGTRTLVNAFTVEAALPTVGSLNTTSGIQGQNIPGVIITGNFLNNPPVTLSFGSGITVNSFSADTPGTHITADITISASATTGLRNVSVTTAGGTVTSLDAFTVNAGVPTISSVSPNQGNQGQTITSVIITGTFLTGATAVTFDGTGVGALITANSATQITARVTISASAATGFRDVSVTTPGGTATLTHGFIVNGGLPTISLVSPNSGIQGQPITVFITGTYLTGASVSFGTGVVDAITANTATQITVTITPEGTATPGLRNVSVVTGDGAATLTNGFTVKQAPPTITSLGTTSGGQGAVDLAVTINGTYLTGATAVTFSGTGITVNYSTVVNATRIDASITISPSAAAGLRNVSVTTPGGTVPKLDAFTVTLVPPTPITVSSTQGTQGQTITGVIITGNYFTGATAVTFSGPLGLGVPAGITNSFTVNSATQITATITISASAVPGLRDVSVTTAGGIGTKWGGFTVNAGVPTITTVTPNNGVQGLTAANVIITGTFLTGATSVSFGAGITNDFTVDSATKITAKITITGMPTPTATEFRTVSVTTPGPGGGTATKVDAFTVKAGVPTISTALDGVAPDHGLQGAVNLPVAFNGTFLTGATVVSFGTGITVHPWTVVRPDLITTTIDIAPTATLGTRTISVTTPGGTTTRAAGFTVTKGLPPTIASLGTATGKQGQVIDNVIITGTNFSNPPVSVSFGAGITVNSFVVTSAAQITAKITISGTAALGTKDVSVTTVGGKDTKVASFTVTQGTPTITSVSPNQGAQGATINGVIITGTFFTGATAVTFSGTGVTAAIVGTTATNITVNITITGTATLGASSISVTTPVSTATKPAGFTVTDGTTGWKLEQLVFSAGTNVYTGQSRYQTFTPAADHYFNSASFDLYKLGSPNYTVTIALYNATGGKPTGDKLCSTTFNASSLTTTQTWKTYTFPTGYWVTTSGTYALVLSGNGGDISNHVVVRVNDTSVYGGGQFGYSTDGGLTWITTPATYDLAFKEGQNAI